MPTRAQVEGEVVGRARVAIVKAAMAADPVADPSPRDYLNDPIRRALVAVGAPPDDPFAVADADLAGLAGPDLDNLLDAAELFALETALNNIDAIDVRTTDVDQRRSQYAQRLATIVERKRRDLDRRIGLDVQAPEVGLLDLGTDPAADDGSEFA